MKICDTHAVLKKMFRPPTKSKDTTKQSLIFYIRPIRPPPKSKKVYIFFMNDLMWIILKLFFKTICDEIKF
jgi:hypothetical protein